MWTLKRYMHMMSTKSQLIETKLLETPTIVVLGNGQSLEAMHQGETIIPPNVRLTNVLYVPGLKENIFLVCMASTVSGAKIVMENGSCQVMKDGEIVLIAKKGGGIF